jgi:hypothetical protein
MSDGHDQKGRFANGNPGGPGRPRQAIEREYLAVLGEAVSLDDWREVVVRALAQAKAGSDKAREWLTRYLLGNEPPTLLEMAAKQHRGLAADDEVADLSAEHAREAERQAQFDAIIGRLK